MPGAGEGESASPLDATIEPKVGHKIGPYRLVKLLGQGSSGRVFEVEHVKIGRRAAMKTLSPEHAARPGALKRLFTEALAVNRISNPHIVEVTDLVENGEHHLIKDGRESVSSLKVNALVMELLEGQSLAQAIIGEGPMPPERFLPILAEVAEALAAAHAAGFIHRDLKPENVFLANRGGVADFVKLLDFGLTKALNIEPELVGANPALATQDGTFMGTPAYASPEQAGGKSVDHRTDIYALGVITYELVCGRLPFEGDSVGDYIIKHLTVAPPPLPDDILATKLGRALDAIIQRCLQKDPAARFPSAAQLAELFAGLARGEPVQFTAMESYVQAWPRPAAERRRAVRLGAGVTAGLALAVSLGLIIGGRGDRSRDRAASAGAPAPQAAPSAPPAPAARAPERAPPAEEGDGDVSITFESDPPGARARLADRDLPLGVTPFQRSFARHAGPLAVEISLDGYEPLRVTVPTASSRTINVALTRATGGAGGARRARSTGARPAAAPPSSREPASGTEREQTLDPFR